MVKGQTLIASDGLEVCLYPLESIRITQSYKGDTSHGSFEVANTGLWDVTGISGDNPLGCIIAPFSGKIVACKTGYVNGNQRILASNNKVHLPDGTIDYANFGWGHDKNLLVKLGDEVKQGQIIGYTGTYGFVTGEHSHLMIGKGKWTRGNTIPTCWNKKGSKIFYMPNAVNIDKLFFKNKIRAINTSKVDGNVSLNWEEYNDMDLTILQVTRDTSMHQVEILEALINARSEHSTSATKYGKLPVGVYNVYETYDDGTYTWCRVGTGVWIGTSKTFTCFKDYPKESGDDYKSKYEKLEKKYDEEVKLYNELSSKVTTLESKIAKAIETLG